MRMLTLALLLALLFVACGPATPTPTSAPEVIQPARSTPTSDPSLITPNANEPGSQVGYPPPPPTLTPLPEGYPAAPTLEAANPYPAAGTVWVLQALGLQCADTSTYQLANVQAARASLTAAGITVQTIQTVELGVCEACDCPTSTHYRAQIAAADLNKALALGWRSE
ncbi:MAG: hypothetical protein IPM39_07590 [Chloroflexi bacterium]|nr:hypothetical protein [Chloroflexota bacterium]